MDGRRKWTPNRELLREIAALLGPEEWIESIAVFPSTRPDSLVISLRDQYYPREYVSEAYIEVQSYLNGGFHVTYVEDRHGDQWLCRWNRHESADYTRDHFHTPPKATHEDGVDREYPTDLIHVLSDVVAPWVYDRLGDVWREYQS